MFRVLIVDDEPLARGRVARLLEPREDAAVVAEAGSLETAVRQIDRCRPNLIFLDIELQDGFAFELFERTKVNGHVVFLTAYRHHALRAFEVNALDYLLKPVRTEHLERARARAAQRGPPMSPPEVSSGPLVAEHQVYLREPHNLRCCRVSDIVSIEATIGYTDIRLQSGEVVLVRESVQSWARRLPPSFVRIHRSKLANLEYFESLNRRDGHWELRLRTLAHPLSVSRRCFSTVKEQLAARAHS